MQCTPAHLFRRLTFGSAALLALSSCSLPPREAWRQIQREGLIPFVMNEWGLPPSPAAPQGNRQMIAQQQPAPVSTSAMASSTAATGDNFIGPPVISSAASTPSPAMLDATQIPVAQSVPGLTGYVRTPHTDPPRLVDVRGMTPGSKVVCPFTHKPFLVPTTTAAAPRVATAPSSPEPAKTTPAPSISPTLPAPSSPVASLTPSVTTVPTTPSTAPTKPQVAANLPPVTTPPASQQPAAAPKTEVQDIPFGIPITGRPGFVNSPFAAKHQLVDVTGLPTGMEVKCPYTGKLFRVPPQDQAQGRIPVQNTASPEKK